MATPQMKEETPAPVVVETTPVATETPVEEVVVADPVATLQAQATNALAQLASMRNQIKEMETFVKSVTKEVAKLAKAAAKGGRRQRRQTDGGVKAPSGFAKKTKVTEVLTKFLADAEVAKLVDNLKTIPDKNGNLSFEGLDADGCIARPAVTKIINAYIKHKNLQEPSGGKNFKPDAKLKKLLLPLKETDAAKGGYSFFNLQHYTTHLYIKEKKN